MTESSPAAAPSSEAQTVASPVTVAIPAATDSSPPSPRPAQPAGEIGGPTGPEPTRFGDWERKGRCSDF
jgi:hypothetical protein